MEHSYSHGETLCLTSFGPLPVAPMDAMDLDEFPIFGEQEEQDDLMQQNDMPMYNRKKNVSFGGVSITHIESSAEMDQSEKDLIWFRRTELDRFKYNAKKLCKLAHKGVEIGPSDSIRGMDVYFPSRQRAHGKFIFHVLQAYHVKCDRNSEYVGELCESWSRNAKERALVGGIQDFYGAYFPHMVQNASSNKKKPEITLSSVAAATARKRTAAEFEPTPRRA